MGTVSKGATESSPKCATWPCGGRCLSDDAPLNGVELLRRAEYTPLPHPVITCPLELG